MPNVLTCVYMYLKNEKTEIQRQNQNAKKHQDETPKRERKKERLKPNKYHPHLCPRLCT
jgi:hypothetical protein